MCLAVPMRLVKKEGDLGLVELGGVERNISLMMLPDAVEGEYVIVHAGFAIQKLDEEEARKTLDLLMQMGDDYSQAIAAELGGPAGPEPDEDPE